MEIQAGDKVFFETEDGSGFLDLTSGKEYPVIEVRGEFFIGLATITDDSGEDVEVAIGCPARCWAENTHGRKSSEGARRVVLHRGILDACDTFGFLFVV